MNSFRLLVFTIVIALTGVLASPVPAQDTTPDRFIPLRELLREIGNKYDCQFTIELGWEPGPNVDSLRSQNFRSELQEPSLEQELIHLRGIAPYLTYRLDGTNSKLIHIIDGRLSQVKGYAIEQVVGDINFNGGLFDLVNEISKKGVAVSSRGAVDIYESMGNDLSTSVHVKEINKNVRYILTNALTLKERGRVLWIAETELGKDRTTTYVRYLNRDL